MLGAKQKQTHEHIGDSFGHGDHKPVTQLTRIQSFDIIILHGRD